MVAPGDTVSVEGVNAKSFMLTTSAWVNGEPEAGPLVEGRCTVEVGTVEGEDVLVTWEPHAANREAASTAAKPTPARVRFEAVGGFVAEEPESLVVILNTYGHS